MLPMKLILQRTYKNVLKDGPKHHITACYCQSFLCFLLPLQNVLKLDFIVRGSSQSQYMPQWRKFYHIRLSFLRPGFKSRWRIFIFQKKGEIRTFLNEITLDFRSKMLNKFVLGPMGQGVYNFNSLLLLYFSLCAVHYYVLCITTKPTPSVSFVHSMQQQVLQNQSQDANLHTSNGK